MCVRNGYNIYHKSTCIYIPMNFLNHSVHSFEKAIPPKHPIALEDEIVCFVFLAEP